MSHDVLARVAALPQLSMGELAAMWKELFQHTAPKYNKSYLVKRLAYRLQEIAYGIDASLVTKRLDAYAREHLSENLKKPRRTYIHMPVTGTKLVRLHRGVEHQVTVLGDGFEYKGARYKSLSQIAYSITGAHWSGPVFFGLVRSGGSKA